MTKPRKRIYLVNRDFQLRYAFAAVLVGLISTFLTGVVVLYPLYTFEILRIPRFLPLPILMAMVAAAVVNVLLIGLFGVFITHRIAGPMYALVRCFRRIEMGRWAGHLKIREDDDLKYLVRNFNKMVDGLIFSSRTDVLELEHVLTKIADQDLKSASEQLDNLKQKINERLLESSVEGKGI